MPVLARERELAALDGFLDLALAGEGRVAFVTGDPGSGKTTLLAEFARRAMAAHPDLLVAQGNGNAYTGQGDPYLPFLEVLQMLTGDIEARWAAGALGREHARRLWALVPQALQALVEQAPELVDLLVPGAALLARARPFGPAAAPWLARLEALLEHKAPSSGGVQQGELFERTTRFLQALARRHPLLLVLDDLQWADEGSLNLLFHLGRKLAGQRILVLGAYRTGVLLYAPTADVALGREGRRHPLEPVVSEFRRTWGEVVLDLAVAEGRGLIDALLDQEPNRLGAAFRETLYRHTGGQALFTVELLRGLQERGDPSGPSSGRGLRRDAEGFWVEGPELDWGRLPARVEAVIGESLGRLAEEDRALLTVASVEGEEFTAEVLARVRGGDPREIIARLSGDLSRPYRLVGAQSVQRVGAQRLSRYRFRHYLFQRHLYEGLDPVQRADLHEQVALALEALHGAEAEGIAAQLAYHYEAAGLTARAVACLQQAGARATRLHAHEEAVGHLRRCAALLASLPETPQRARAECIVQLYLSYSLMWTRGNAVPERGQAAIRAYELAQQIGEPALIHAARWELADYHSNRGNLREALRLLAQTTEEGADADAGVWAWAHCLTGWTLLFSGELTAARRHLEQAVAPWVSSPPAQVERDIPSYHQVPHLGRYIPVYTLAPLAFILWLQGYPEQATRTIQQSLALGRAIGPHQEAVLLADGGIWVQQAGRDLPATRRAAEQLLSPRDEGIDTRHRPQALVGLGWAQALGGSTLPDLSGQAEQGIATMRRGLQDYTAAGTRVWLSAFLAMLAEGYACAGQVAEGLDALSEALEHVERTDERFWEAELHRLRGELLLQEMKEEGGRACGENGYIFLPERSEGMKGQNEATPGGETEPAAFHPSSLILPPSPEACFQQALHVARRQEARWWELRASVSLARLWQRQGKRAEAHQLLAAIYGWFTEGFETPGLRAARGLLEELAGGTSKG